MLEKGKIVSLQQWRHDKVDKDMSNRVETDDDAYFEKNQTLKELCERQKQFASESENDYNRGIWNGIELAKQIINEFI